MPIKLPKNLSKDRHAELKEWVYKVWDMHWKRFAPVSNSRAQFLQYVLRDHKELTPEILKKIELSVVAYHKHLKMKSLAGDKLVGIRTLSVWYNQNQYEDEFIDESAASMRERTAQALKECTTDGCHSPVHGVAYIYCTDCIPQSNIDMLRSAYKELPINPKKGKLQDQLKAIFAKKRDDLLTNMDEMQREAVA